MSGVPDKRRTVPKSNSVGRKLVIVENPAKAEAIGHYLGDGYDVLEPV
jgi:hypothetical protein